MRWAAFVLVLSTVAGATSFGMLYDAHSWVVFAGDLQYLSTYEANGTTKLILQCDSCFDFDVPILASVDPHSGDVEWATLICPAWEVSGPICMIANDTFALPLSTSLIVTSVKDEATCVAKTQIPTSDSITTSCLAGQFGVVSTYPTSPCYCNTSCDGGATCSWWQGKTCTPCRDFQYTLAVATDSVVGVLNYVNGLNLNLLIDAGGQSLFVVGTTLFGASRTTSLPLQTPPSQFLTVGALAYFVVGSNLFCVNYTANPYEASTLWNVSLPLDGSVVNPLVYSDAHGLLLIPTDTLIAVSTKSVPGFVAWQSEFLGATTLPIFHKHGTILVGVSGRGLVGINPFTGKIFWTEPIAPWSIVFTQGSSLFLFMDGSSNATHQSEAPSNGSTTVVSRRVSFGNQTVVGTRVNVPSPTPPSPKAISRAKYANFICAGPPAVVRNFTTGCNVDFAVSDLFTCSQASVFVSTFRDATCAGNPTSTVSYLLKNCYVTETYSYEFTGC